MNAIVTVKDIADETNAFLDNALGLFRSNTIKKFIFIEGNTDRKLLINRGYSESLYNFLGMRGKPIVLKAYESYLKNPNYQKIDKILFLVDADYDLFTNKLVESDVFTNFSYCKTLNELSFNDVDVYLVNSGALKKLAVEWNIPLEKLNDILKKIEMESRRIGKYRAANELLKIKYNLPEEGSILYGFNIENFFDNNHFLFLEAEFEADIKRVSSYKHYTSELFDLAHKLSNSNSKLWCLSRGHDVTNLLRMYLKINHFEIEQDILEEYLRLSLDQIDFENSVTGSYMLNFFR